MRRFVKKLLNYWENKKREKALIKKYGFIIVYRKDTSITLGCFRKSTPKNGKIDLKDPKGNILKENIPEEDATKYMTEYTKAAKADGVKVEKYLDNLVESNNSYRKGYNYQKPYLPKLNEIKKLFGEHGVKLYNEVTRNVRRYRNTFKNNELRHRVLVSGVISRKYIKGIITHTNFPKNKLNIFLKERNINRLTATLDDIKSIYKHMLKEGHIKYDLHPFIEKRLKVHFDKLGPYHNGIKHTNYNWRQTGDLPGIHAEVLSLNELLWKIEAKGYSITDDILIDIIGFNRNFISNNVMIRCGDCNFITRGISFIEKF